jgi:hypothetical protein
MREVLDPVGTLTIEDVQAVTHDSAISLQTPATPGTGAGRPPDGATVMLRNNSISAWPGRSLSTIEMNHDTSKPNSHTGSRYDVYVQRYQGQSGNDFRVYFDVQGTQNIYGSQAPCTNTTARPEIRGITCPMSGNPPPPPLRPMPPTSVLAN